MKYIDPFKYRIRRPQPGAGSTASQRSLRLPEDLCSQLLDLQPEGVFLTGSIHGLTSPKKKRLNDNEDNRWMMMVIA